MACAEKACAFPEVRDGLCAIHLRDRDETGRPFEAKTMEIDWNKVQERRNNGTPVSQLAKENDVTTATIYNRTDAPKQKEPVKHAGRYAKVARLPKPSTNGNGHGSIAKAIAELEEKRDKINAAIEVLRELEA